MNNTTFESFPKIARLSREMVITCKIDGTNGQVYITPETSEPGMLPDIPWIAIIGNIHIAAGSRNRWITPEHDNYGFAKWVQANSAELFKLGPGRHSGEWWGRGIQRGYGLAEKRFSLFDVNRWIDPRQHPLGTKFENDKQELCPTCCHVVPVLYRGIFDTDVIDCVLEGLSFDGSKAAPGFFSPEGIVIYHTASKTFFKKTIEHDEAPKSNESLQYFADKIKTTP